jgi:dihydroxyacetone synthase
MLHGVRQADHVLPRFLVFYLYAAAAVRMGALMRLQVIHIATHDSIAMGEGGPTHQPLEVAALLRAMPNFLYIRPGDSEETAGAWIAAIEAENTPTLISTSRHKLPQLIPKTSRDGVLKGAYVLEEDSDADLTIIGVGAELSLAVDVAVRLRELGRRIRIVSFPCHRLFESQPLQYKRDVLRQGSAPPAIVIEPYVALGWERYADAAVCMSTDRFGHSLPCKEVYEFFGFDVKIISKKISKYLDGIERGETLRGEFVEL